MSLRTSDPSRDERTHMNASDAAWRDLGARSRHYTALLLVFSLFLFILWSAWASVDEVTKAQGQVVPSQRVQIIQHLEGGILADMLVREGDSVEPDDVLARVDNVAAASAVRESQNRALENEAAIARLEAELEGREPVFSPDLVREAPHLAEAEKSAWETRLRQYAEEDNIIASQIEQRGEELHESENRRDTLTEALSLTEQREKRLAPLVQRKLHSEVDYLATKQEVVRLRGEIASMTSSIAKLESAIRELGQRKDLARASRHSDVVKELGARRSDLAGLRERLITGADRVTRTELKSPVRGIVNRVLINTRGGIVRPGGEIMEIIPRDDSLLVEAKVRPADIAFIHPGQKAVVKITAYDSAVYGSLGATVEQISADTITSPQGEVYYLVKVRTTERDIVYKDRHLPITPGMVASVDILTGKKTILQYLLKPLLKAREGALRER